MARHLTDRLARGKNFSPSVPLSGLWHITDRVTLNFRGAPLPLDALTKCLRGRPVRLDVPSATHSLGLSVRLSQYLRQTLTKLLLHVLRSAMLYRELRVLLEYAFALTQ